MKYYSENLYTGDEIKIFMLQKMVKYMPVPGLSLTKLPFPSKTIMTFYNTKNMTFWISF